MADQDQVDTDADTLYAAVLQDSRDDEGASTKTYTQETLLELSGFTEMKALLPVVQHLTSQNLFRTAKIKGKLAWSPRPRNAARQINALDSNEKMIYVSIEEAHTSGIWSRDIRKKTQLQQHTMTKALNKMEKMNLIKSVKSVKNLAQRTYMLFHLVPSEDVTGNSFFDSGDLDESFRDELMKLIIFWVRNESWVEEKRRVPKREPLTSSAAAIDVDAIDAPDAKNKRKRSDDIEDAGQPAASKARSNGRNYETEHVQLVYKAGSHDYPTTKAIHQFITNSNAIRGPKATSLTVQEIQGCIDVLVWDEKLECVPNRSSLGYGYRTVRGVTHNPEGTSYDDDEEEVVGNGLTQAPCGRCPVFDLCHEDSPINPAACIYYDQWIEE